MPSKFIEQLDEVDGFNFPQPPLPPTKKHNTSIILGPDFIPASDCPFLTNVGEMNGAVIVHGGFHISKPFSEPSSYGMKCYPPLPNAAYGLTSQAHVPKDATNIKFRAYSPQSTKDESGEDDSGEDVLGFKSLRFRDSIVSAESSVRNLDGTAHDRFEANINATAKTRTRNEYKRNEDKSINDMALIPPPRQPLDLSIATKSYIKRDNTPRDTKSRGELLAESINFNRQAWVMTAPGVSGPLYPADEQRADFVNNIDHDNAELEHCRKCNTKHIPPGSPITLQDRDPCGAYLPEWFPVSEFEKPWNAFTKMMNDMVLLDEISQGYGNISNPDEPTWDLQFHEYASKWRAIGRRGGWWKCRGGEDATTVERECNICHNDTVEKERFAEALKRGRPVADRQAALHDFIKARMKEVGKRDEAIVLAHIREEGYPQYLGTRKIEEERFRNPFLSQTASNSTIWSHQGMESDSSPVRCGWPIRGGSSVRR